MIYIISVIILMLLLFFISFILFKIKGFEFTIFLYITILFFIITANINLLIRIITYFLLFIVIKIYSLFKYKRNCNFSTYFGVPGSGKTTVAACLTKRNLKRHIPIYSNVDIKGAYSIDKSDIGVYSMENGLLILDECGTEFDNRSYKTNFTPAQVKWFKKHRHYGMDVVCFSQYWNDIDIKLRNLSTNLYLLTPSLIPFFVCRRKIRKRIGINKDTKDIIDEYSFIPFSSFYFFSPSVWKMFQTHDKEDLPIKEFDIYE